MTSDSAVFNVLSNYTALPRPIQAKRLGGAGGFSGANLWQVAAGDGRYCLRRWPEEHPDRGRLALIHSVLRTAASKGLSFVPAPLQTATGTTFIEHAGSRWELTPWLPGTADFWTSPSPARLSAAFRALARFHQATRHCAPPDDRLGEARAIVERAARLTELASGGFAQLAAAVNRRPLSAAIDRALREALPRCPAIAASQLPQLTAAARHPVALQPAIRDIWHDHVLFEGDRVTGIVDYGAMRIDTALTDIARLVGSLVEDDARLRQIALDAYAETSPLTTSDRELVDLLDHASVLISLANWAQWLYVEGRQFDNLEAVAKRIEKLAARVSKLR